MIDINKRLMNIFSEVFEINDIALPVNPEQRFIEQWDSLSHLRLIMAVESEFNIRFNTEKIPQLISFKSIEEEIENVRK